ncbi:MAG: NPCBM/NEW2 domain-containing protein [Pirellulales bacterium]
MLAQTDEKFEVWRNDGQHTRGKALNPFYQSPDEKIVLDGKPFKDAKNPVRAVLAVDAVGNEPPGPWVEFTNGDRLPAKIVRWSPAQQIWDEGARGDQVTLNLEMGNGAADITTGVIQVRPECIAACYDATGNAARYPPGTIVTADGRRIDARGMRFREPGLECLTEAGVVQVSYDQLANAVWPRHASALAAENDALWSGSTALPPVAHVRTARGLTLTAGNLLIRRGREGDKNLEFLALRPNWCWQTLRVPPERVRWVSWRGEREVPLTAFPHQFITTTLGAKRWPPRVDHNVLGEELHSGEQRSDSGWGTHSGTKIVCTLPAGVERISGWVGIDHSVGRGGCAKARIVRDGENGETLWQSEFLFGDKPPQRYDIETRGARASC